MKMVYNGRHDETRKSKYEKKNQRQTSLDSKRGFRTEPNVYYMKKAKGLG